MPCMPGRVVGLPHGEWSLYPPQRRGILHALRRRESGGIAAFQQNGGIAVFILDVEEMLLGRHV